MLRSNKANVREEYRPMARSAKIPLPTQDELESHEQLSLFAAKRAGEIVDSVPSKLEKKPATRSKKQASYSAADIQVLEGIAAIRHRPGMYIGSTSASGLLHLLWEALDNAVDEALAGYGNQIWVGLERDGWMTVRDEVCFLLIRPPPRYTLFPYTTLFTNR